MLLKCGWVLLFSCLFIGSVCAQRVKDQVIEERIELVRSSSGSEANVDYYAITENLEYYYDHPLNLNNADREKLEELSLLNDVQIKRFLEHIKKNGKLIAGEELQTIKGFSPKVIRSVLPFVTVKRAASQNRVTPDRILRRGSHSLFLRYGRSIQVPEGFRSEMNKPPAYKGGIGKMYARYRYRLGKEVSMGLTAEKDPGEMMRDRGRLKGFDFYSGHLMIRNRGFLKALAVGDYQVQFGQGLSCWSGLSYGRSGAITSLKKSGRGLVPYTSSAESRFLRGGAATVTAGKLEVTSFYSRRKLDASVAGEDEQTGEIIIRSVRHSGYHRTENELAQRKNVLREQYGLHLDYEEKWCKLGLGFAAGELAAGIQNPTEPYRRFSSMKRKNSVGGVDYNFVLLNMNIFGEAAIDAEMSFSTINGLLLILSDRLTFSFSHRYFQRAFRGVMTNVSAQNSRGNNENGMSAGFRYEPLEELSVSLLSDRYKHSWLEYRTDAPSEGYAFRGQLDYRFSGEAEMYFRIRHKVRQQNDKKERRGVNAIDALKQMNYRLHLDLQASEIILLKSRLEYVRSELSGSREEGYLLSQDVVFKTLDFPLSLALRYALFHTDSYRSRIYSYENDVLYAYSIPAYYDKGARMYVNLKYRVSRWLDLWVKWARTRYADLKEIGSGNQKIEGPVKSDVKLQLRLKF